MPKPDRDERIDPASCTPGLSRSLGIWYGGGLSHYNPLCGQVRYSGRPPPAPVMLGLLPMRHGKIRKLLSLPLWKMLAKAVVQWQDRSWQQ